MKISDRFTRMYEIGCICCRDNPGQLLKGFNPAQIHHITDKGYKRLSGGDNATIPLCPWHHQGIPINGRDDAYMIENLGPSFEKHKKKFIKKYGTERNLLDKVNKLLEEYV